MSRVREGPPAAFCFSRGSSVLAGFPFEVVKEFFYITRSK